MSCVYVVEKVKEINAKLNEEEDNRLNEVCVSVELYGKGWLINN